MFLQTFNRSRDRNNTKQKSVIVYIYSYCCLASAPVLLRLVDLFFTWLRLHKLSRLAEVHNIAVVVTNQVQSQPDGFFAGGNGLRATGGNIMGHASTYRILLRKAGAARIAIMIDSPCHAYDQIRFAIPEAGVQDVQEDKGGAPEW
jgi:hypothetical protein